MFKLRLRRFQTTKKNLHFRLNERNKSGDREIEVKKCRLSLVHGSRDTQTNKNKKNRTSRKLSHCSLTRFPHSHAFIKCSFCLHIRIQFGWYKSTNNQSQYNQIIIQITLDIFMCTLTEIRRARLVIQECKRHFKGVQIRAKIPQKID